MHGILGGRWKRRHASRTEAHGESCGYATGRYSGRASALPDRVRFAGRAYMRFRQAQIRLVGGSLMPAALHSRTGLSVGRKGGQKEEGGRMARVGGHRSRPGGLD